MKCMRLIPIWKVLVVTTLFDTRLKMPWICNVFYLVATYKAVTTLQGCEHLAKIATTLSQPYKVAARLLQPSYFHMGNHVRLITRFYGIMNHVQHKALFGTFIMYATKHVHRY